MGLTVISTCPCISTHFCQSGLILDSHGGGFSSSVVSQEGGDLSLVEAERQSVHRQLLPMTVNLYQVLDVDTGLQVSWLLLHTYGWKQGRDTCLFFS